MTPEYLLRAVEHFSALCQADSRVAAAFVGGSLATGTADQYSDLDLYVITSDQDYTSFFTDRATFMGQFGEPVYLEDFNGFGFDMVLFIFKNGIKGELGLAKASHFLHIHGGPYRILVDKTNLLQGISFPLDHVPPEEQCVILDRLIKSFWRNCYLLIDALDRRRLLTAAGYFEDMRRQLLQVCRLSVDFADGGTHPPSEKLLPKAQIEAYRRTFFHLEREAMTEATRAAIQLFQEVARPLALAHGVVYPEELERVVLSRFAA